MTTLFLVLYGLGFVGVLGLFYLLKVPFNWFNVVMALLLVAFVGNHLFLFFLVGLGVLYLKERFFPNKKNENGDTKSSK